jgi:Mrp family chromosome partitioning ATPase
MVDLSAEMADLWTSLGAPARGRARVVEFIAAREGEGTSSVAREFALYAAREQGRRTWLVDLDLMGQCQAEVIAGDPERFGALGAPANATPDGSMFVQVQPPLKRPDGRAWPDARYVTAFPVGEPGFWVTRFRREALRGRQTVHVLPDPAYWNALRRHADLIVIDAPATDRSHAGLTIASSADDVVLVLSADDADPRASIALRDGIAEVGGHCAGLFVNRVKLGAPKVVKGGGR